MKMYIIIPIFLLGCSIVAAVWVDYIIKKMKK